ncbi:aspartate/glutamate racemase family protein [Tamlana sp. 2_MG-2023]|uniref:aspartate/glutamate racemase family protein n=1 Tax=unclassified Tamlana TaxID=2614803 RepID=UPI0026E1CAEA|nr:MULTISPECIES: aspartate/glutamate racemase family protein [unclassified Tamlana]MDO6761087.1 aspartate/glutamate racemase family protein [Tamlana sp. 2_MG-2023]MDO6791580.1 aspartate/glutamate racemase family protein [Tamlana sp. 1_MG-2023]
MLEKNKLGLLGLGNRSTLFYINGLNSVFNKTTGGYSTCPFTMINTNFDAINLRLPDVSEALSEIVQAYISEIENMGITYLLVPNITLHETIDGLKHNLTVLHPVKTCIAKLKENHWKQVVLFGSMHTMQSGYIRSQFAQNNIETRLPEKQDMLLIDQVRTAVYAETQTETLINEYRYILNKYAQNHPVVLACTELSVIESNQENVIDMAQLQIEKAVNTVL